MITAFLACRLRVLQSVNPEKPALLWGFFFFWFLFGIPLLPFFATECSYDVSDVVDFLRVFRRFASVFAKVHLSIFEYFRLIRRICGAITAVVRFPS